MGEKKRCSKCGSLKSEKQFFRSKKSKDGFKHQCKICHGETSHASRDKNKPFSGIGSKAYEAKRRNKIAYLHSVYSAMTRRVNGKASHSTSCVGQEILPKDLFFKWTLECTEFDKLFTNYQISKFNIKSAPSIDRIDIRRGYILENMQWLTFSENARKQHTTDYKQ